ncbi:MAG: hypothetical protein L0216_04315, partial [Planctomycetales bacterium]|nr:hypothetical protein [Planctomycetales bacterium]
AAAIESLREAVRVAADGTGVAISAEGSPAVARAVARGVAVAAEARVRLSESSRASRREAAARATLDGAESAWSALEAERSRDETGDGPAAAAARARIEGLRVELRMAEDSLAAAGRAPAPAGPPAAGPDPAVAAAPVPEAVQFLRAEREKLRSRLERALLDATDAHPDVRETQRRLRHVEARLAAYRPESPGESPRPSPPVPGPLPVPELGKLREARDAATAALARAESEERERAGATRGRSLDLAARAEALRGRLDAARSDTRAASEQAAIASVGSPARVRLEPPPASPESLAPIAAGAGAAVLGAALVGLVALPGGRRLLGSADAAALLGVADLGDLARPVGTGRIPIGALARTAANLAGATAAAAGLLGAPLLAGLRAPLVSLGPAADLLALGAAAVAGALFLSGAVRSARAAWEAREGGRP